MLKKIRHTAIINERIFFPEIAAFLYRTMVASESLLELAVTKANGKLKEYFKHHLEEERQHEKWLADDLEEMGIKASELPYNEIAAQMAGSQYYILHHGNPVMFLGYMLFLEGFPASERVINELELLYGKKALRTIRYHALHDQDHRNDLLEFIDGLSEEEKTLVLKNAQDTADSYGKAMNALMRIPFNDIKAA